MYLKEFKYKEHNFRILECFLALFSGHRKHNCWIILSFSKRINLKESKFILEARKNNEQNSTHQIYSYGKNSSLSTFGL